MSQTKDQEHLDRPAPHAAHHGQPLDHFLRRHSAELGDGRDVAARGVGRQVPHGPGLGFGESGSAQPGVAHSEDNFGSRERLAGKQGAEPPEDSAGGLARELLVDDAPGQ